MTMLPDHLTTLTASGEYLEVHDERQYEVDKNISDVMAAAAEEAERTRISAEAAMYAKVNRVAATMVPLMLQEFDVRFKGSQEAARLLNSTAMFCSSERSLLHLAGKTIKVRVNWSCLRDYLWLTHKEVNMALIHKDEFKKVITQKGMVKGMFELWKDAAGHNKK